MNVNDGTVPCPTCGGAVQGSTIKAVLPLRAKVERLEAGLRIAARRLEEAGLHTDAEVARMTIELAGGTPT